jgi:hypothetical protein
MQKALVEMNLQLHNVISDITGATGMRILRDIVCGVTDPVALATHRDYRCRASEEEIAASLTGNYRAEHLFALRQNLELFDTIQRQIQDCDGEVETLLQRLARKQKKPKRALPQPRCKFKFCDNEPRFEIRDPLFRLSGADLTQIDGIDRSPTHRRDRNRYEPMADLQALHLVADPGPQEQGLRRTADQLQDPALGEQSRLLATHVRHGPRPHLHGPRRLLSPHRLPRR